MPPFVLTYTTLVENMKNYAERGTSTDTRYNDNIPVMIARAENRLAMRLKTLLTRPTINDTLTPGNPTLTKPSYWRNTVSMMVAYGTGFVLQQPMWPRTKEFIQTYWPNPATTGVPRFYGDYDENHWILGPTPTLAYPVQYVVDQSPVPLSAENQTNLYTIKAPLVLQAACFLESDIFLKNWDNMGAREKDFEASVADLTGEKLRLLTDRSMRAEA